MKINKLYSVYLTLMLLSNIANAASWTRNDSPFNFKIRLETDFKSLPIKAEVSNKEIAWPANHWDNVNGGIAYRWSAANSNNFTYKSPSYRALLNYTPDEISELSPAEKYSIYIGDYNYNLVQKVWSQTSPNEASWNGICHGVAPASVFYNEPKKKTVKNRAGISIEFYSSDIKALLAYFYANIARTNTYYIGKRCNRAEGTLSADTDRNCSDLNPGSFHLILANIIGLTDTPVVADIDRYSEVWNHAALSYESYEVEELMPDYRSAIGTVRRIQIQTSVKYAGAINRHYDATIGTDEAVYLEEAYEYYIELDYLNRIIGGSWISSNRPDFLWTRRKSNFRGSWNKLNELL